MACWGTILPHAASVWVYICGLIKVTLPFPMNSFSCLYPLKSSGSGQPVSFSSTQCCLGVEEVSCCSDEMCLQLHLFFSWVLQQIPGLQRWSFDKKSKIILSTSIWCLWICHCTCFPSLKERRTKRVITPFFIQSLPVMSSVCISYCCTGSWCLWTQESLCCWAAFSLDSAAAWFQRLRHCWWEIARSACCTH